MKKRLTNDSQHTSTTHYRWIEKLEHNRYPNKDDADYKDEWQGEQCFACQFYIELEFPLGSNWGACSNPASPLDGRLMFEHDGCEHHSLVDDDQL